MKLKMSCFGQTYVLKYHNNVLGNPDFYPFFKTELFDVYKLSNPPPKEKRLYLA